MDNFNRLKKEATGRSLGISLEVYRKVGLVTIIIGVLSALSFLTTYTFLYGYYFGGEINNSVSNFELFRRFVPFHINTITFTYLMIALSVTLIIYTVKITKEKGIIGKGLAFCAFIVFHSIITIFFTQELTIHNVLYFGLIWLLPLVISIMASFVINGMRNMYKTTSGFFYGIILVMGYVVMNHFALKDEEVLLLNFTLFIFGSFFYYIPYNKWTNVLFLFPYFALFLLLIIFFITEVLNLRPTVLLISILIILIPLLFSLWFASKYKDSFKNKENNKNNNSFVDLLSGSFITITNTKSQNNAITFIILMTLFAYVIIPRMSFSTAKLIRSFTPSGELQYESIFLEKKLIKGNIVAEQDNVIYISNRNSELEQIKISEYHVTK